MGDYCKYYKQKLEITQDEGQTWVDSGLRRRGDLYEPYSEDCCIFRWEMSGDTICNDCSRYITLFKQEKCNDGAWRYIHPYETELKLVEANSIDCGFYGYFYIESLEDNNEIKFTGVGGYILNWNFVDDDELIPCTGYTWPDGQHIFNGDTYTIATINKGEKIAFYNNCARGPGNIGTFKCTKAYEVGGNIMSLVNNWPSDSAMCERKGRDYCFDKSAISFYRYYDSDRMTHTFAGLFLNSTTLVSAEKLNLYDAPTKPMIGSYPIGERGEMPPYCYAYMFAGCTSLIKAPKLPATGLREGCYNEMFMGCTSLTEAPELPAIYLETYCYNQMFSGCTSLTKAPELNSTNLNNNCYYSMFNGCTSLTTAPELPATTLAKSCYARMFNGCTSLTTAPELPATTLAENCYACMFDGCTSLNSIKCLATDISASQCTYSWVNGVASSGTFTKAVSMTSWTEGINGIPSGWVICGDVRWVDGDYLCIGHDKWQTMKEQIFDGSNWIDTGNISGKTLVEESSDYCLNKTMSISGTPYIYNNDKYINIYNQESDDCGETWVTTSITPVFLEGNIFKYIATLIDGSKQVVECDSSSTITYQDREDIEDETAVISVQIGNCVTTIGTDAFNHFTGLISIDIPSGITNIDWGSIRNCTNLKSVTIPDGVTTIGAQAFLNCYSLKSITIPDSVTTIDAYAFQDCCNLESIYIPSKLKRIERWTFQNCSSLTSVTIPESVTYISREAFKNCVSLSKITLYATVPPVLGSSENERTAFDGTYNCPIYVPAESVEKYKSANGWIYMADRIQPIEDNTEYRTITTGTICSGFNKYVVNELQVTRDYRKTWTTVSTIIGNLLEENSCDCGYRIEPVLADNTLYRTITTSTTCSGYDLYAVDEFQVSTDSGETWETVSSTNGIILEINSIDCGYKPYKYFATYSDSHTESAECDSSMTISSGEINLTNLIDIDINVCVNSIGYNVFQSCYSLTSVTIPNSVTNIGSNAFEYCSGLTSVTIPDSVTYIGHGAFERCSGLTSITIPSGVTFIDSYSFYWCISLTSITVNATTPPMLGDDAFEHTNDCPIYVPSESVDTYKSASRWRNYASRIQAKP